MKRVEFPAGSGAVALYDDNEAKLMSAVLAAAEVAGDARVSQMQILHDLKCVFGLNLVTDQVEFGPAQPGDVEADLR